MLLEEVKPTLVSQKVKKASGKSSKQSQKCKTMMTTPTTSFQWIMVVQMFLYFLTVYMLQSAVTAESMPEHKPKDPLSHFKEESAYFTHDNSIFDLLEDATRMQVTYYQAKKISVHLLNYKMKDLSDGILVGIDNDALLITEASKTYAKIPSSCPQIKAIINTLKISIGHSMNSLKTRGRFCGIP